MHSGTVEHTFQDFQQTGSADALARTFDLTAPHLLLIARHLTHGAEHPEDLVQATFVDAMQHADRYDTDRPLMPWLIGILTNHARNLHRKRRRRVDQTRLHLNEAADPAAAAEASEFVDALGHAIAELDEKIPARPESPSPARPHSD